MDEEGPAALGHRTAGTEILDHARNILCADQVTFRILYTSKDDAAKQYPQIQWIEQHKAKPELINDIKSYIKENGRVLEILEFGATRYSIDGLSVVIDEDCMNEEAKQALKYVILQPNCKLYTKWDDEASLLF
jgi:reverse gyrase